MTKPTATLVARQSASRGERDPSTQFQYAEDFARNMGWDTLPNGHVERSVSGGRALEDRPGLLAALADVRESRASRVLVSDRDRLDRNLDVRKAFVAAVEEAGGEVWAASGGRVTFSTADAKRSETNAAADDEHYREKIAEKVARQKRERIEAGLPVTALPGIGVMNPGGRSPVRVIEDDREHVVTMFAMFADGKSSADIAAHLREQGYAVTKSQVLKWLRNEVFIGNIVWGSQRHDGAHEAIVPPRLWRRVQARFESMEAGKAGGRKAKSELLLARLGVLRCAGCGGAMIGNTKVYVCSGTEQDCPTGEGSRRASMSSRNVEAIVLAELARQIVGMRGQHGDALTPALAEQERANTALAKLRDIARLADDVEGFAEQIREAKARVGRADAAVDDARSVAGVEWTLSSDFHGLPGDPDFTETPLFEHVSREQLRDMISTVFERVTVARRGTVDEYDRVAFTLHKTFDLQPQLDAVAADMPVIGKAVEVGPGTSLREAASR